LRPAAGIGPSANEGAEQKAAPGWFKGERVRHRRKAQNLLLKEAADLANISIGTPSSYSEGGLATFRVTARRMKPPAWARVRPTAPK
jgi:hypothetical protein